jgi:GDP-4-dehydro-6-deoxy-D-mannose reductase
MVGSHLADLLFSETDWQIFGMTRWRSPLDNLEHLTSEINLNGRIKLVYGDLSDEISIRKVVCEVKPDYVFHLAAQSFPQTSFTAPIQTFDVNISGTYRLLNAIYEFAPKAKTHICSSSEVFGRVPKEFVPIKEDTPFHPASPYAISKVGTDLVGTFFSQAYGLNIFITRMFTHTGPRRGDVFAESSFAKQIALAEVGVIPAIIKVGNLNSVRTFADVRDAVRAYYLAMITDIPSGSIFNIGGDHTCSVGEMLEFLVSLSTLKDIKIATDIDRIRPIDADLQIPDVTHFKETTGWKQNISFERSMIDLLEYWRVKVKKGAVVQR